MNEESNATTESGKRKPLVLIIDDNPRYAHLFELLAERLGIVVLVVNSCEEGMQKLKKQKFDVIMMDWLMPEVDGLACTKKIRLRESETEAKNTAIIGVSGYIHANKKACVEAGMDDFLEIPFTLEQLHEKLSHWLKKTNAEGQVDLSPL